MVTTILVVAGVAENPQFTRITLEMEIPEAVVVCVLCVKEAN